MVDRRLGRGLDFFLSGNRGQAPAPPMPTSRPGSDEETLQVPVGQLGPSPFQPRKEIGEADLAALADSIRSSGILQPILARRVGERYEIVAGERRWRAAQLAGLERVPVLVRRISDDESAIFGLVENVQREDLNAIEKATGFQALLERLKVTQEEVAKKVGLDRSSVANFVRLLDLPDAVQAHVSRGTLSMGHARALLGLVDKDSLVKLADECIRLGWSVRALEQQIQDLNQSTVSPASRKAGGTKKARPVWLNEIEETLVEALATKVTVRYGRKRSQIVIECAGREEFERVYQRLKNA